MRLRLSLAIGRVPAALNTGMLVSRINVFDDDAGICVRKMSGELSVLIPSFACADDDGNVPSGRKFRNEANTRLDGARAGVESRNIGLRPMSVIGVRVPISVNVSVAIV